MDMGYSGAALTEKLKAISLWDSAIEMGMVVGKGANGIGIGLTGSGKTQKQYKEATSYLSDLPIISEINNYQSLKLGETKLINNVEHIRVGRWMSPRELDLMKKDQRMISGAGGQTFISLNGAGDYKGAASAGSVYVEFNVPIHSLLQGGNMTQLKYYFFKNILPKMNQDFLIKERHFYNGDFGNLHRFEFFGLKCRLIGNLDFWSLNWLEIHLLDLNSDNVLYHKLLSPDKVNEKSLLEFEDILNDRLSK